MIKMMIMINDGDDDDIVPSSSSSSSSFSQSMVQYFLSFLRRTFSLLNILNLLNVTVDRHKKIYGFVNRLIVAGEEKYSLLEYEIVNDDHDDDDCNVNVS